jgi:RHS repeat-associated protein
LDDKVTPFNEQRKFTGHEFDAETGLSYMGARYQDGRSGRFVSQDPVFLAVGDEQVLKSKTGLKLEQYLVDPQGFNSYAYARNNPLKYVDEQGNYFETALDIIAVSLSAREYKNHPTFWNSFAFGLDSASLALPFPAVVGYARHGDDAFRIAKMGRESGESIVKFGLEYVNNMDFKMTARGWTKGEVGEGLGNLVSHYVKHGEEVGAKSVSEYYSKANSFIGSKGTYSFTDPDPRFPNDIIHFNPTTNQKVITDTSGNIKSFYVENRTSQVNTYKNLIKSKNR